ncbi:MAG: dihydrofolate reductase [Pseudomonadales bacterium]|jgi:dihydrofolate reductase|nr:dihydrofolate reductase [Pseudomonadales bacterium]
MKIALVVAVAQNRVIGKDNALPWHLPEDLKYFKRITLHKPVIMGRKTYDSIGKPLVGRVNIVVTRNTHYRPPGVLVVNSLESALERSEALLRMQNAPDDSEIAIIGGAQIFADSMALADRLYLTEVHAEVAGDIFFPAFAREDWLEVARADHPACAKNPYPYSFVVLERKQ